MECFWEDDGRGERAERLERGCGAERGAASRFAARRHDGTAKRLTSPVHRAREKTGLSRETHRVGGGLEAVEAVACDEDEDPTLSSEQTRDRDLPRTQQPIRVSFLNRIRGLVSFVSHVATIE